MFSIANNISQVKRELRGFQRDQLPFAISLALNETGRDLLERNKAEMNRVFDRPTRWTLNAFRFQRATKRRLMLTVERKRTVAGRRYLEVQAQGGKRGLTGREGQIAGKLGGRVGYVSAPNIRRNAHGNISRAQMSRILSGIGGGGKYFTAKPGSRLAPGVYLRKRKNISRVLAFGSKAPNYRARYDFDGIMRGHAGRVIPGHLRKALARAQATAR